MAKLYVETAGRGSPALVLLHGVGVNGAVWRPLLAHLGDWPGRIVIPDLRGHGRSPHGGPYGFAQYASDVAELFSADERVFVVAHSMGTVVGLALASGWFGITVEDLFGFGLKVSWPAEEIARLRQFAASPVRWFGTRREATDRFLRVAGLVGLVEADAPVVEAGIVEEGGRFRLAADPAAVLTRGELVGTAVAAARAKVRLACGSDDPIVSVAELQQFDPGAFAIEGCAHNAHVEAPAKIAALIRRP
jgi:pimeloyl-ACP methyl ester carboxylesterase